MTYPLISEYVEAVRNAEDNFEKLRNLRPVTDGNGNPVMSSGNFAVVFKMRDEKNDKLYAVKCFLKDQPNRAENYRMIAEELEYVASSFLTKFQYLDKVSNSLCITTLLPLHVQAYIQEAGHLSIMSDFMILEGGHG